MPSTHPLVDLANVIIDVDGKLKMDQEKTAEVSRVVQQLNDAFSTNGFAYLKNHGLDPFLVDKVFQTSRSFFELPLEIKNQHPVSVETLSGYSFPQDRYSDRTKQKYDFSSPTVPIPDEHAPELRASVNNLATKLTQLVTQVLKLLALALGLEEDYLSSRHKFMFCGAGRNITVLTSLYYVPLTDERAEEVGGIRAAEHVDYGTLTLILQDDMGGLEVLMDGKWVEAPKIPGAILIVAGETMQMWTADRVKACVHRVVASDEVTRRSIRQSLIFFANVDDGVRIAPLDGSDKYPAFVAPFHAMKRGTDDKIF